MTGNVCFMEMNDQMDKNKAVKRIRSFGKVGFIICVVLEVLVAAAFVFFIFCASVASDTPENIISFSTSYVMEGRISAEGNAAPQAEDIESIAKSLDKSGMYLWSSNANIKTNISYEDDAFVFTTEMSGGDFSTKTLIYAYILFLVALAFMFLSFFFAGFLFRAFAKCESPFDQRVITRMRLFAFSLLPWAVFSYIQGYLLSKLLNTANMNINVNLAVIFTILVIFALTYIFKYGAVLQKESDETL